MLGLVIGLLLGLGIALAVAVYVTKVPVPLVDRGVQRPPSQDAVEAERNRNWNPNATLSGRPATGGAPAASAPATAPGAAPAGTVAAPAGTVAAPAANPADPLGELIQSRTQTAAAAAPVVPLDLANAPDPFIYFVQAGAFRSPGDAEAQRARLAILGMDAKVTEREQAGQPIYRVRVGPFDRKATADEMQASLTSRGFEAALVRVQR